MSAESKVLQVGLGDAMRRLLDIEIRVRHGITTPEVAVERDMLLEALNRVEINLGFDCDSDGLPDTVDLFRETSETSCCRLIDLPGVKPTKKPAVKKAAPPPAPVPPAVPQEVSSSRLEEPPPLTTGPLGTPAGPGFFSRMFNPADAKKGGKQ